MSKPDALPFGVTLHVRDRCLCLHAQRAARALARRFDDALRPAGLTSGQFSLLMALNRPEPPRMGQVAALLAMDRTTLTANVKPLERRGLLLVMLDADDKRGRRLALTAAGRAALAEALPLWQRTEAAVEAMVDDADRLRADLVAVAADRQWHGAGRASEDHPPPLAGGEGSKRNTGAAAE